ncbi:hypothetical protein EON64_11875 [archaeon]|nr:MAG: hypothetical protein EON64_11875 [archaeon]
MIGATHCGEILHDLLLKPATKRPPGIYACEIPKKISKITAICNVLCILSALVDIANFQLFTLLSARPKEEGAKSVSLAIYHILLQ